MKTLVFITSHFPYGTGESFIDTEFPRLQQDFNKIVIISQDISGKLIRNIPENIIIKRYDTSTSLRGFLHLPFLILKNLRTIKKTYKDEFAFRKKISQSLTLKQSAYLLKKIIKAIQLRDFIAITLIREDIKGTIVFYSYWLNTGAHAIGFLNCRESIRIARAHGSDLYEENSKLLYLPLLKFSAETLNAIFFVSEHGRKYLAEKIKTEDHKFILSRLGTEKPNVEQTPASKTDKFTIVTCSNLVPLKRIDLLIYSLAMLHPKKQVEWLHFGDGILKDELKNLAAKRLGTLNKINNRFMGQFSNSELLKYYSTHDINLFVNTSSTEGIPVSIMEAQSFGIPVIATNTGGVKELVVEGTGTLLPADFHPADLAKYIQYYTELPEAEMIQVKMNAFNNWSLNFNATLNYKDFVNKVNSILAPEKNCSDLFL